MKKIYLILMLAICSSVLAQENWGIDFGYRVGLDRFNHAYSIKNVDNTVSHKADAFIAHNAYVDIISWNESSLWSANLEGLFYWVAHEISLSYKPGPLKSTLMGFDEVREDNPQITTPVSGSSDAVHPDVGAGDYQFFDFDIAWGNKVKVGLNFAGGFLGANDAGNGIGGFGVSSLANHGAQVPNVGYLQYGLIGHYLFDEANVNQLASLSISRMSTFSDFDERIGYAIELDYRYFLGQDGNDWRPYVVGFAEFRKFQPGETNVVGAVGNPIQFPALRTIAIGLRVGVLMGNLL